MQRDTLTPGAKVAHFRIVRELGKGGYGVVHLAEDLEIPGRLVALKSVRPGPVMPDAELLRHEAAALAALQHPHILVVHEVGEGPSGIFLAAEYMPGGSVADRIVRDPPLTEAEVLTLARSAADALAAAHQAGLIHRDFKPGNLLLAADGLAKVADFGIAMRQSSDALPPPPPPQTLPMPSSGDATMTATVADGRIVVGTPAYMPPEIFSGVPWSARGDQFSFGILLHEMLTGLYPFDLSLGMAATRSAPVLAPALAADLRRIVARCLERDPNDRFPDMRAVVEALDEARLRRSPERKRTWRVATAGIAIVAALVLGYIGYGELQLRRARSMSEGGVAALKRGDRDAARAAFVAAHSADPSYEPACTNLGQMAAEEENPSWAVTILRDCASEFPESAPVRYNLGAALARSGNLQPGIAELTRALELAGTTEMRPLAANELALAYIAGGRPREAIALIEGERPSPTTVEGAVEVRTLGLAYIDAGESTKAIAALTSALSGRLPADKRPATLVALGRAAEAAGAPNDAVRHFSQALVEGATEDAAAEARAGLARLQSSLR